MSEMSVINAIKADAYFSKLIVARAPRVADDGAIGLNIPNYKTAAQQRDAAWLAYRGVVTDSQADIDNVVRALKYAFLHQNPAGYFENALGYTQIEALTGDAFFLQAFGRIYLLLQESLFAAGAIPALNQLGPQYTLALTWLYNNAEALRGQDFNFTNRLLFDAIAYALGAKILNNSSLKSVGETFVNTALAAQRADGVFPEAGGYDSSYQGTSIMNLGVLYCRETDAAKLSTYREAISRGIAWENTRVAPSGEILSDGNSRTAGQEVTLSGDTKGINYPEVAMAYLYASKILGDDALRITGDRIISYMAGLLGV